MKTPMLESHDPADWREDHIDEQLRANLHKGSNPVLIRQLYPLRAQLIAKCPFNKGLQAGHIYEYARTAWAPSPYPIQVLDLSGYGPSTLRYASNEVEILPVE